MSSYFFNHSLWVETLLNMCSERIAISVLRITFPANIGVIARAILRAALWWHCRGGWWEWAIIVDTDRWTWLLICGSRPAFHRLHPWSTGHLGGWKSTWLLFRWTEWPHIRGVRSHVSKTRWRSRALLLWPNATSIAKAWSKLQKELRTKNMFLT